MSVAKYQAITTQHLTTHFTTGTELKQWIKASKQLLGREHNLLESHFKGRATMYSPLTLHHFQSKTPRLKEALAVRPQGVRPWSHKLPLHNSTHKKAITNDCSPILSPAWISSISFHHARKLSHQFQNFRKTFRVLQRWKEKEWCHVCWHEQLSSLGPEGTCFLFQKISILQVCSLPKHFPETLSNPYVHTFQMMSQQNHPCNQWVPLPLYSGI